jgi:hypothetical protein
VFVKPIRDARSARSLRSRKAKCSFWPSIEPLENRIALHGGAVPAAAIHVARPAVDAGTAGTQVLSTMKTSIQLYSTLQAQLDGLAVQIQKESRAAQQKTAKTAQTLINQFVAGENQRYQQVLTLAKTVPSSQDFTALLQLEKGVHNDLINVKSLVGATFTLLVGATYTTKKPSSRVAVPDTMTTSSAVPKVQSAKAHPFDGSQSDPTADGFISALGLLLRQTGGPLTNIMNSVKDDSSAFTAAKSLLTYKALLAACDVFYETLEPELTNYYGATAFIDTYNAVVKLFNAAVDKTNAFLSTCTVHTHPHP